MSARDWVDVVLAGLLVINLLVLGVAVTFTLRRVANLSERVHAALDTFERDTASTLQQARQSLEQLSVLSETLTGLVRSQVVPTTEVGRLALEHVERTLKGVEDATTTIRRLAAGAEALTAPSALSAAVERVTGSPLGRVALLVTGLLALSKGILRKPRSNQTRT